MAELSEEQVVATIVEGIMEGAAGIWVNSRRSEWYQVAVIGQRLGLVGEEELVELDHQTSYAKFPYTAKAKQMISKAEKAVKERQQ